MARVGIYLPKRTPNAEWSGGKLPIGTTQTCQSETPLGGFVGSLGGRGQRVRQVVVVDAKA